MSRPQNLQEHKTYDNFASIWIREWQSHHHIINIYLVGILWGDVNLGLTLGIVFTRSLFLLFIRYYVHIKTFFNSF